LAFIFAKTDPIKTKSVLFERGGLELSEESNETSLSSKFLNKLLM
jgi:hypothetical protein